MPEIVKTFPEHFGPSSIAVCWNETQWLPNMGCHTQALGSFSAYWSGKWDPKAEAERPEWTDHAQRTFLALMLPEIVERIDRRSMTSGHVLLTSNYTSRKYPSCKEPYLGTSDVIDYLERHAAKTGGMYVATGHTINAAHGFGGANKTAVYVPACVLRKRNDLQTFATRDWDLIFSEVETNPYKYIKPEPKPKQVATVVGILRRQRI
jgi:hypothetical protein